MNASIDSCPPFPGKERHLLRAQLARISHATELCPKGTYEADEEGNIQLAAEQPATDNEALRSLEAWAHLNAMIKKSGKTKNPPAAGEEEGGGEGDGDGDDAADAFRALQEDKPIVEGMDAWISRVCGDLQPYKAKEGDAQSAYAVNVVRSLRWPGAVTVAKAGVYCSVYVGDGLK